MSKLATMSRISKNKGELDPIFLEYGQEVYTYDYIEKLRDENNKLKARGQQTLPNLIPQAGFQERVLLSQADIKFIGGKRGSGKATSVDSMIVTPTGYMRLGALKVGDIISDPMTGGKQIVTAIYEHPQIDLYEVTFNDGTKCECCDDHLWKVKETSYYKETTNNIDHYKVWPFRMIREWIDKSKSNIINRSKLIFPLCEPIEFNISGGAMKRQKIDPYLIGVLLGAGDIAEDRPSFSAKNAFFAKAFKQNGWKVSKWDIGLKKIHTYGLSKIEFEPILKALKLNRVRNVDKFIPQVYKWGKIKDRWALLQGLMDSSGGIIKGKFGRFRSVSEKLSKDVMFVARSLGALATLTKEECQYTNQRGELANRRSVYVVDILIKDADRLFRYPKTKEKVKPSHEWEYAKEIVSYRYIGKKDARCITVDSCHSLYMLQDFTVTHNTFIALFEALPYMFNSSVNMYGFRKYKDDIDRGIWESSSSVFSGFGIPSKSNFEWNFCQDGKGAKMKMEHLADERKVKDRFRGVEMTYVLIEEVTEHTRENLDTIFALLSSNRSTSGVKPKFVCTCNPVGKSNKLRVFLDWWIDPETDTIIPERDGKIRYFFKYGKDSLDIIWGNTPEEVYSNPRCKIKIDKLCKATGASYDSFITSVVFIEGEYSDNKILQISDPKYMNRISAEGGESVANDIIGVWRDFDSSSSLLTAEDMERFFNNTEQNDDGVMRASADVAIKADFLVLYAFKGHHVCDIDFRTGIMSDDVIPFIETFLHRNGVRKENFTFDQNGLGTWISESRAFKNNAVPFNNKSAPSDTRLWNNLKSECAELFIKAVKSGQFSISQEVLNRKFQDKKKHIYSVKDRLLEERHALKRKDSAQRFEIIDKSQMKVEVGHSPDFIEGLFMVMHLFGKVHHAVRKGFENI